MNLSQQNAIDAGAELILEEARLVGARCGLTKHSEAPRILEVALAKAYAEVALFYGANDSPERLRETIGVMATRMAQEIRLQHAARRGAGYNPGRTR